MVQLEPEEEGVGESQWTCECHAQSQRLLRDWKRALAQQRPTLLARLQREAEQEREATKKVKTNVSWTELKHSSTTEGSSAPFSFSFG